MCGRRIHVALIGRKPAPMVGDFAQQIASDQVHVAVDGNDELQGFIVFFPKDDHLFLENVAVRPEAAGRRSMIQLCQAEAQRLGLGAMHLYTNEKMTENLSISPRLGYQEVVRRSEHGFDRRSISIDQADRGEHKGSLSIILDMG